MPSFNPLASHEYIKLSLFFQVISNLFIFIMNRKYPILHKNVFAPFQVW